MSDGHHHGGDAAGQPGLPPGMFPPHEPHRHAGHIANPSDSIASPFDPMTPGYGRRRSGVPLLRPRAGSAARVVRSILGLVVIAFMVYVAFQVFHGVATTP
jgi:hypothetical protein